MATTVQGPIGARDEAWRALRDGSVVAKSGRVVYFSVRRFKRDVCHGNCCFVCGLSPKKKTFNDEHVLPEWILRRYGLFHRSVTLPNRTTFRYDRYAIPCCADCNTLMGEMIENPVRTLVAGGHRAVTDYIRENGGLIFFVWMALIFLKTHLRDKAFRLHRDLRAKSDSIASIYDWETLHHIHTVARSFFTGATLDQHVIGTTFVLPARREKAAEPFDFADLYAAQTLLLRMDDVAMLTVFNDSCAATPFLLDRLEKAKGPFSALQLREIMVDAAACNLHLRNRPRYRSFYDLRRRSATLVTELEGTPDFLLANKSVRGALMEHAFGGSFAKGMIFIGWERTEDFWKQLREGKITFLYDNDGNFIEDHLKPISPAEGSDKT